MRDCSKSRNSILTKSIIFRLKSNSLFWSVASPESPARTSVIMGTIHLVIEDASILSRLDKFIQDYEAIYTETTLHAHDMIRLKPLIQLSEEDIWSNRLGQKRYDKLRKIFNKSLQVDIADLQHIRPIFAMSTFYDRILRLSDGVRLDQKIWNYGLHNDLTINGLEHIDQQINILQKLPLEEEFDYLRKWGRNVNKMTRHVKKMYQYYLAEDLPRLHKVVTGTHMAYAKNIILTDRNYYLAERIEELHEQEASFFSFGAGHLWGYHGVLPILKRKGYLIKSL